MEPSALIGRLETQGAEVARAFRDVPHAEIRWRPAGNRWSVVEILGHFVDEETGDFRLRIQATLEGAAEWEPIDPEGWVIARNHAEGDFDGLLATFEKERAESLAWLRTVEGADWTRAHEHASLGRISAGDLLASWALHDQLHLAQLARTRAEWTKQHAAPWSTTYAAP